MASKLIVLCAVLAVHVLADGSPTASTTDTKDGGTQAVRRVRWTGKNPKAFAKYYADRGEPVIIENAVTNAWPAVSKWNPDYLRKHVDPSRRLPAKVASFKRFGWGCCSITPLSVTDFFAQWESKGSQRQQDQASKGGVYTAGPVSILGDVAKDVDPTLLDVGEVDPKQFPQSDAKLTSTVWMGSAGAVAPLHHDAMHNYFVQIYGRKRFTVFPPADWHKVYLFPKFHLQHRNAQVNIAHPNVTQRYPLFSDARPLVAELGPGDVLYLPPLWFHEVESLSPSISVNVWSPVLYIEQLMEAWGLAVPLQLAHINPRQVLAQVQRYAFELYFQIFPRDSRKKVEQYFVKLLRSRYAPLYGVNSRGPYLLKEQKVNGGSSTPPQASAMGAVVSDDFDPADSESGLIPIEMNSPEGKQYQSYLQRVKEEPPRLMEPGETGQRLTVPQGTTGIADADGEANIAQKNYTAYRDVYLTSCSKEAVESFVRPKLRSQLSVGAARLTKVFRKAHAPRGVVEIYLAHYLEDLIAQLVGDDEVYAMLKFCVLNPY